MFVQAPDRYPYSRGVGAWWTSLTQLGTTLSDTYAGRQAARTELIRAKAEQSRARAEARRLAAQAGAAHTMAEAGAWWRSPGVAVAGVLAIGALTLIYMKRRRR